MEKTRIAVVDYGMGNLRSVASAFNYLGCHVTVSSDRADIEAADAIVLPGVGAFPEAMANLKKAGLVGPLSDQVVGRGKPFLGICLGMQLIATDSEEGGISEGLDWIPGHVRKLRTGEGLRLPHVGWNELSIAQSEPLFKDITGDMNYYFVHSYHMECDRSYISARCFYGQDITAAVQKANIFATQFHPEKSQKNGLRLIRDFIVYARTLSGKTEEVVGA